MFDIEKYFESSSKVIGELSSHKEKVYSIAKKIIECQKNNKKIKARIISNQSCIVGGLSLAKESFKYSYKKIIFNKKLRR